MVLCKVSTFVFKLVVFVTVALLFIMVNILSIGHWNRFSRKNSAKVKDISCILHFNVFVSVAMAIAIAVAVAVAASTLYQNRSSINIWVIKYSVCWFFTSMQSFSTSGLTLHFNLYIVKQQIILCVYILLSKSKSTALFI